MRAAVADGRMAMNNNRSSLSHTASSPQAHSANVRISLCSLARGAIVGLTLTHLLQAFADVFSLSAERKIHGRTEGKYLYDV
jgi:hypothetical protein